MSAVTPHPSVYRVSCYGCGKMYVRRSESDKCPYCPQHTVKFYECCCASCGNTVTVNSFDDACKYCGTRGKWVQGVYDGKDFSYMAFRPENPIVPTDKPPQTQPQTRTTTTTTTSSQPKPRKSSEPTIKFKIKGRKGDEELVGRN